MIVYQQELKSVVQMLEKFVCPTISYGALKLLVWGKLQNVLWFMHVFGKLLTSLPGNFIIHVLTS